MYTLIDTFNARPLSRHRSLLNALRASYKHARAVERFNGSGAYVKYGITEPDGSPVDYYDLRNAEETLRFERL